MSDLLVGLEVALTLALLSGTGVMVHSMLRIYSANLGVDATRVLAASFPSPPLPDDTAEASLRERIETRVTAVAGVESVAFTSNPPAYGAGELPYEIAGAPSQTEAPQATLPAVLVSPGYFRTLRVPVRAGREFTRLDGPSASPVESPRCSHREPRLQIFSDEGSRARCE